MITTNIRKWSPACTYLLVIVCLPKALMNTAETSGPRESPVVSGVLRTPFPFSSAFYCNGAMTLYVFSYLWRDGYLYV